MIPGTTFKSLSKNGGTHAVYKRNETRCDRTLRPFLVSGERAAI